MNQARIVDHVLAQYTADHHVTHPDDVEYARARIAETVGHALAFMAEHPEPVRWDETRTGPLS